MARSDYSSLGMTEEGYNSASTQFFIMTSDRTSLVRHMQHLEKL
jgi:cyclophilin family peptidyl-prolyl cis-trans isomerase